MVQQTTGVSCDVSVSEATDALASLTQRINRSREKLVKSHLGRGLVIETDDAIAAAHAVLAGQEEARVVVIAREAVEAAAKAAIYADSSDVTAIFAKAEVKIYLLFIEIYRNTH